MRRTTIYRCTSLSVNDTGAKLIILNSTRYIDAVSQHQYSEYVKLFLQCWPNKFFFGRLRAFMMI